MNAQTLSLHQLATVLPFGVKCTCGAELPAVNAPIDDERINGDALALALHQLQQMADTGQHTSSEEDDRG